MHLGRHCPCVSRQFDIRHEPVRRLPPRADSRAVWLDAAQVSGCDQAVFSDGR
jgi:hypothetical protein